MLTLGCARVNEMASSYIWPLSRSAAPDEMNTSYGPRINLDRWNFHDGIDLPAPIGTPVHAICDGIVLRAGDKGEGFTSRHVVLEIDDPADGAIFVIHLHLASIAAGIKPGKAIVQKQRLGTVGDDGASYPHLHLEFRKGTPDEASQSSVHPLHYLPYTDTANFVVSSRPRFNRFANRMASRIAFGASGRREGDLVRVEVELRSTTALITTRRVDFDDKATIRKGKANKDTLMFKNNIGVEGYQKSDMKGDGRSDLEYGVLVRNLPSRCRSLTVRVVDVANNVATSEAIAVPDQPAAEASADFEDGLMPPVGWNVVTSNTGTGTTVRNDAATAHDNTPTRSMICIDDSSTETTTQRAAIEASLAGGRFEWAVEAWFKPVDVDVGPGELVFLLHFLSEGKLSVAACARRHANSLVAGIVARNADGTTKGSRKNGVTIAIGHWRKWKLHLLRLGTRESTAVLYLDSQEKVRLDWDSTGHEPDTVRVGIGRSPAGATATLHVDEVKLTESPSSLV